MRLIMLLRELLLGPEMQLGTDLSVRAYRCMSLIADNLEPDSLQDTRFSMRTTTLGRFGLFQSPSRDVRCTIRVDPDDDNGPTRRTRLSLSRYCT